MEQHPIPQQITSYEFKLVGDMTLKQFGKAAGGIIIAMILNSTGLVFFIRWPLMLTFAAGGLALAFLPFQDRPLETWLFSFFKSIYSPTIYTWKKRADKNWLEIDRSKRLLENDEENEDLPKKDKGKVEEFIASLPSVKRIDDSNEEEDLRPVKIKTETKEKELVAEAVVETTKNESGDEEEWQNNKSNLGLKAEKDSATGKAVFGDIPMPDTPDVPNLLVGMVTDTEGKIVEGALVEMQDTFGNSARVLKTNPLGQFKTATQLANGTYLIIPEKQGLKFDKVNVILDGKIMKPIKIQALA